MTATQAFLIAGGVIVFFFLLAAFALLSWLWWRRQQVISESARQNLEAAKTLASGVAELQKAVAAMAAGAQDLPALEKGLIKVSQDQVAVLMELRDQQREFNDNIAKLYGSLFSKDSKAYQEYDEKTAGRAYRIQELVEHGIPQDEAERRAEQEAGRVYHRGNLGVG